MPKDRTDKVDRRANPIDFPVPILCKGVYPASTGTKILGVKSISLFVQIIGETIYSKRPVLSVEHIIRSIVNGPIVGIVSFTKKIRDGVQLPWDPFRDQTNVLLQTNFEYVDSNLL